MIGGHLYVFSPKIGIFLFLSTTPGIRWNLTLCHFFMFTFVISLKWAHNCTHITFFSEDKIKCPPHCYFGQWVDMWEISNSPKTLMFDFFLKFTDWSTQKWEIWANHEILTLLLTLRMCRKSWKNVSCPYFGPIWKIRLFGHFKWPK